MFKMGHVPYAMKLAFKEMYFRTGGKTPSFRGTRYPPAHGSLSRRITHGFILTNHADRIVFGHMTASGDGRLDVSHVRAVIHVDDADVERQRLASANVLNLLDDTAVVSADIEIVFNGAAIWALTRQSALTTELAGLQARGVALLACDNSMRAAGITIDQLIANVTVVPSGISHLVRRQHEKWAYIRP